MDEIMIVTGLVGALVASSYKWGYFVFATVALFFIAWNVTWVGRKRKFLSFSVNSSLTNLPISDAQALGRNISRTYVMCGTWTIFLWFIYPIAWGLSEGGNVIAPDSEAVFYGVLDILAKPVFGALLLFGHRNIDPAALGLHIRDYDDNVNTHEKNGGFGSAAAHNNTTTTGVSNNGMTDTHHNTTNSAIDNTNTTTGAPASTGVHNNTSAV
jgi:bacteriorhodopsin